MFDQVGGVVGKAQEILDAVAHAATVDPHAMAEADWMVDIEALLTARNTLDALIATRLQAGDVRDITVGQCGRTTKGFLVEEQHLSRTEARRRVWLARQLPSHPEVADAFSVGEISAEHARLIISCLGQLNGDWQDAARAELLDFARSHDPGLLAQLIGQLKIRTGADESAEAQAARRHRERYLTLDDTFQGMVRIDGMLDPASAATVRAALEPLLGSFDGIDLRRRDQRYADALVSLAQAALTYATLPDHGGDRPQVMAITPLDYLTRDLDKRELSQATLDGRAITPATARMIACDAGIIPVVLSGKSEILDIGRSTRTWTTAQRRAAALRDRGCVFPHCQITLPYCHLHHLTYWAHGGPTDHHNSAHLCHFHHWLVHHTHWNIQRTHTGTIEVHRT
jgi:hypothetical protein